VTPVTGASKLNQNAQSKRANLLDPGQKGTLRRWFRIGPKSFSPFL
jgi:hypothetical protein